MFLAESSNPQSLIVSTFLNVVSTLLFLLELSTVRLACKHLLSNMLDKDLHSERPIQSHVQMSANLKPLERSSKRDFGQRHTPSCSVKQIHSFKTVSIMETHVQKRFETEARKQEVDKLSEKQMALEPREQKGEQGKDEKRNNEMKQDGGYSTIITITIMIITSLDIRNGK